MGIRPDVLSSHVEADLISAGSLTDVQRYAASALRSSLLKKFEDDSTGKADAAAIALFRLVNSQVGQHEIRADTCVTDEILLGCFRERIFKFYERHILDCLNGPSLYFRGRVGPGASIGAEGTDFYTKLFSSHLTCTSEGLYRLYKAALEYDPRGKAADILRMQNFEAFRVVRGSRLTCVPKNVTISRTICTEPTLNMFFQLGLGSVIEEGLRRAYGINISRSASSTSYQQQKNRDLARKGSLNGEFCTIDLSSASDRISLQLVDKLFPKCFGAWLKLLRCSEVDVEGKWEKLNMLSTMGNGYTFPLQTLIFATVVDVAYHLTPYGGLNHIPLIKDGEEVNFGVYGDDIICDVRARLKVYRLLELLGFVVNEQKSFFDGDFRESCGGDYFRGHDVRGVYVKTLRSVQDRLVVWNRLADWSASHAIPLTSALRYIRAFVPDIKVPMYESHDAGLRWPVVPKSALWHGETQSYAYVKYAARPEYLRLSETALRVPRGERRRMLNHHGLLISLLHGSLRHMRIPIRRKSGKVAYVKRRTVTSAWTQPPHGVERPCGWMELYESIVLATD